MSYNKIKDLTGKRFGKLVALYPLEEKRKSKTVWHCICDCGKECDVVGTSLSKGNTSSCGCICRKHGMFGTRIYGVWRSMKERCYVKTNISYPNYGGRGITVCDEWMEFIPFMEWAYANGYDENAKRGECTLDRIDVNGNYCPENCRWVSQKVQSNNTRSNVYIEYKGVVDTLSNHARREGLNPVCVETRKINGKTGDDLFKPVRKPRTLMYKGKERTISEISKMSGISRSAIENRVIKKKEDLEYVIQDVKAINRKPIIRNRTVYQYDKNNNFIKEWTNGTSEICKELGYKKGNIHNCCRGYNKTAYGYIWKYEKE